MTDPFVRVVVLNWNSLWYSSRCLRSLAATEYPPDRFQIVLADNGSDDGSLQVLRARFPHVRVVANGANLGFAEGNNRALRDLDGVDLVALVNNDATVEPGWLRAMVDVLVARPDVGAAAAELLLDPAFARVDVAVHGPPVRIVGAALDGREVTPRCRVDGSVVVGDPDWPLREHHELHESATVWVPAAPGVGGSLELTLAQVGPDAPASTTVEVRTADGAVASGVAAGEVPLVLVLDLGTSRTELVNGLGTGLTGDLEGIDLGFGRPVDGFEPPTTVRGFCGGGALLRADALRQVGVFDPDFFAYYEDTDLSWRLRRAGWQIAVVPEARLHHAFGGAGGSTAPWFFFLNYRNWLLTVLRNGTTAEVRRAFAKALDLSTRSVRGNVIGRARRGRRPSFRLSVAWARVWLGVLGAAPATLRSRRRGRVGVRATDDVGSRLQPRPSFPVPRSRAGGPQLVYLDLELVRAAGATHGSAAPSASPGEVLRFAEELDVVLVRHRSAAWWRCGPSDVAQVLGGPAAAAADVAHRLTTPDPDAVFVTTADSPSAPSGIARSVVVDASDAAGVGAALMDLVLAAVSSDTVPDRGVEGPA
ncbi:MAG: glycosyltransferase family 2 protein [Microthrixaceae bacterium]